MINVHVQNDYLSLIKLGLSPNEAKCYKAVLLNGSLTSRGVSKILNVYPNAVYKLTSSLQKKGFITFLQTHPLSYQAIPPEIAIAAYISKKNEEYEELKMQTINSLRNKNSGPLTKIETLIGREQTFNKFIELANKSQKEILVISLGEEVPDNIKLAHVHAISRGVKIKLLVHTYNKDNQTLLESWVKMKTEVRYYPDAGYHLMIFDGEKSILVASNPENTEERVGIVIYSPYLTKAFRDYFYTRWGTAEIILSLKSTNFP